MRESSTAKVVVPLAGPDFVTPAGGVKAMVEFRGGALLPTVLNRRPWAGNIRAENYSFVMLDRPETRQFAQEHLYRIYPSSRVAFVGTSTDGAALSAAIGVAVTEQCDQPIIVDLADIDFDLDEPHVTSRFLRESQLGGLALTFESTLPCYSYFRRDPFGRVVEAAEKDPISREASTGVYIFRNASVFFKALSFALAEPEKCTYNGMYFVCPIMNGVLQAGMTVETISVDNVIDIKAQATKTDSK